ncbi:MAG: hypothetical protein KKE04_00935 [Candidatus Thermoplasmatota archaeon]|nr:hypothetical protein [Candidatus Thermoplasmatota archaeon]
MVKKLAMKKNKKIKGLVLKTFIVIAVVMMLIGVMPGEGSKINEITLTYEEIGKWSKTN